MSTDALELRATALVLRENRKVHAISSLLLALTGLWFVLVATIAQASLAPGVAPLLGLAVLAGVVQAWCAARVDFDAGLLLALAAHVESGVREEATEALDRTLLALRLVPPSKAGRDWPTRRRGMARLVNLQRGFALSQALLFGAAWLVARS